MTTSLTTAQLSALFPGHIIVNRDLVIQSLGNSLRLRAPWMCAGDLLFEHCRQAGAGSSTDIANLARTSGMVFLTTIKGDLSLSGAVIEHGDGYLLALNHAPSLQSLEQSSLGFSDFRPGDPLVAAHLLTGVQKALIEESQKAAAELTAERLRLAEVMMRIKLMAGYYMHDSNNLLSIVTLNAMRLLRNGELGEWQARCVRNLLESAEQSSKLTARLMALTSQQGDTPQAIMLDQVICEYQGLFESTCGPHIQLRLDLGADTAGMTAARAGLVHAITNLLINAREAMPNGGMVTIRTERIDDSLALGTAGPGRLVIAVADDGPGMADHVLSSAFDLFYSTKAAGTGLGLPGVRDYVNQMGGVVEIASAPGCGTTIRMDFPALAGAPLSAGQASSGQIEHKPADGSGRRRILVVDDEPIALEAVAELFEGDGYDVNTASNAADAMALMDLRAHDVLVTDVVMADFDGIDLAHFAAERCPDMLIILMSGFVPDTRRLKDKWKFIRKPFDPERLRRLAQ